MKYLFSFLCLCCVLSVSAQKPVVINLAKAISESPKEIMLNELASDIRYVPLETTDDCLMNNEFYIMQYTTVDISTIPNKNNVILFIIISPSLLVYPL